MRSHDLTAVTKQNLRLRSPVWSWLMISMVEFAITSMYLWKNEPPDFSPLTYPSPAEGEPSPRQFSLECSEAICDRELTYGMTNLPFKPDIIIFSSLCQIRSLICDVILSNFPHGHKMPQFRSAPNGRQSFSRRWKFRKATSRRYSHFVYLGFFMQVIWGQVSHVTSQL